MLPRAFRFALLSFMLSVVPLQAQPKVPDWPVFRGNQHQTGVADTTVPDALKKRWTFNAQNVIEAPPIVYGQTVLVGVANGKLIALDLATGVKKWEYQTRGIQGAPAARNGAVYVGDVRGVFHAVDAATGKKRWTVEADAEIMASANFGDDKIVFGSNDFNLYCVNTDGKLLWRLRTKEKIRSAPAIVGDRVLIGGCDQFLHVVDLVKGIDVATVNLGGHIAASVAVDGDHAYVGNMANQFFAVDWKKSAILWKFEAKRNSQPFFASPAVTSNLVIAASKDKIVRAFERKTGKEVWSFTTRGRADNAPVVAGNRVVVPSTDGQLYLLDLASGTEKARHEVGAIAGSPAVASNCVIVATILGEVICLGEKK